MLTINGHEITADSFAWDECHKIYLINTEEDLDKFIEYEYKIFPISLLQEAYENSCGLRFISDGDLDFSPVEQGQDAEFKEV